MADPKRAILRIVTRGGRPNVDRKGLPRRFGDVYHLLLESSWLVTLGVLGGGFLVINGVFGLLYWLGGGVANLGSSYSEAFFFSVQTLATIGYGKLFPVSTFAHLMVTLEAMIGLLGLAVATGLTFSKFSIPTARVLFSNVATVGNRDGQLSLVFRMANERADQIVEAQLTLVMTRGEITAEGETIRRIHDMRLVRARSPVFALSWTAVHVIDQNSPLFGMSQEDVAASDIEIIASLVGIDATASATVHARHSYVASEIVWGARFVDIISVDENGRRLVDYTRFHETVPVPSAPARRRA